MSCCDGSWQNYDQVDAITNFSEIDNAMSFLTKTNFIAEPNNPTDTVASWVTQCANISVDGEIITNDNRSMECNNAILETLPADQENY